MDVSTVALFVVTWSQIFPLYWYVGRIYGILNRKSLNRKNKL